MRLSDPRLRSLLSRRLSRRALLASAPILSAAALAACRDEAARPTGSVHSTAVAGDPATPTPAPDLRVSVLTRDLTPGPNRFVFALLNPDGSLVRDVLTRASFRRGDTPTETLFPVIRSLPHVGAAGEPKGVITYFVAEPAFDAPGDWSVDIEAASAEETRSARQYFTVLEGSRTPRLGMPAILSRTETARDEADARRLCSRTPPCPFHTTTVAGAHASGRSIVLNFGSPAHDATSVSSSVLELLVGLHPAFADRFDFIHVEVWKEFDSSAFSPAVLEWGLLTEPWTFVIDRQGRVAGRFESVYNADELTAALDWLSRAAS